MSIATDTRQSRRQRCFIGGGGGSGRGGRGVLDVGAGGGDPPHASCKTAAASSLLLLSPSVGGDPTSLRLSPSSISTAERRRATPSRLEQSGTPFIRHDWDLCHFGLGGCVRVELPRVSQCAGEFTHWLPSKQTEPTMKLVLIPVFISLLDAASATKLQITLPKSLSVREGENVTFPCSFSPSPSSLNHIVIQWFTMPRHYAENMTRREMNKIYQSWDEMYPLSIVKSVGDVRMGDCSIGIPNFPRGLGPVLLCRIDCRRCNAENTEVQEEMVLNVMPAAPRSHGGGVIDATLAPREETSHTGRVLDSWVLPVIIVIIAAAVFVWLKMIRCRSLWL